MKTTFTKKFLVNDLDLPDCAIEDTLESTSRWSEHHTIIFEHEGKFYRTHYSCGLTEMQCESPWEYDDDIECTEVQKIRKQVWVEQWVPVEVSNV